MPTLQETIDLFLAVDRSPYTNRNYRYVLERMARAIGPERELRLITYPDLSDYLQKLLRRAHSSNGSGQPRRALKRDTAADYLKTIQAFFRWCVERRLLKHSPAEGLRVRPEPVEPERHPNAIPPDELAEMVRLSRASARNYAMLLFLADTACRVGGLASLTLSHLDLAERRALLLEKGNKYHRVYFSAQTAEALQVWLAVRPKTDHEYVFTGRGGRPLSRDGIANVVRTLSHKIGRNYGPHRIRHSVAQALADRQVPVSAVQQLLGHRDPRITINAYYRNDDEYRRMIADLHGLAALSDPAQGDEAQKIIPLKKRIAGSG